jgi:alpha-tubulin suppressor-like RCC1 family protein
MMLAGAAIGVLATPVMVAAAPPALAAVHAVAPDQADGAGYYFGDNVGADKDLRLSPTAVDLPAPVQEIGSSNSTEYALLTNGTVYAWGQGTDGQLGNGATSNSFTTAVQVQFPGNPQIAFIGDDANPFNGAIAVDTYGNVWAWGANEDGWQCGNTAPFNATPVQLPFTGVVTGPGLSPVAGASKHAIFNGTYNGVTGVWSCGGGGFWVDGHGKTQTSGTPVQVNLPAGTTATTDVYAGMDNSAVLSTTGQFDEWGRDNLGQDGNGSTTPPKAPAQVSLPSPVAPAQAAVGASVDGNGQTMVQLTDGTDYAWGDDQYGELGDGGAAGSYSSSPLEFFPPVPYAMLASGGATCYGVTPAGDVYSVGEGSMGELGDGTKRNSAQWVDVDNDAGSITATAGNFAVSSPS